MNELENGNQQDTDIAPYVPAYPPETSEVYAESYYGGADGPGNEKAMLRFVLGTVRKHWLLISAITLVVTAAAVLYVAQKPDYYTARARVQVNAENNVLPAGSGGSSGAVIISNASNDPAYFSTQLQVLEGTGLLTRVAKVLDLQNNPDFTSSKSGRATTWQNVKRMVGVQAPTEDSKADPSPSASTEDSTLLDMSRDDLTVDPGDVDKYAALVARIKRNLVIAPVKENRTTFRETRLIDISYTHLDPVLAAKIANAIADTYVLQNLEQKIQTQASAGDFLQKRVAELQASIRSGEERLVNYTRANRFIAPEATQNPTVTRLGDLNKQLGQAENDRIAAQTSYQAAYQNLMRSAIAEGADPQVSGLETQLTALKQKLAQLKTEYTDEWWEVVQVKKQIETLEGQLVGLRRKASDVQLAKLKQTLDEAADREQKLRVLFEQQRGEVIRQNESSINYKIIQQEVDTNKALLDGLLQKSRENDVILSGASNNVLVSERATTPLAAAGPERSQTVMIAFLASLIGAGGLALILGWLDDSIHYSDDIEANLGLPLLAAIPAAAGGMSTRLGFQRLLRGRSRNPREERYDLTLFERPEIAESYIQMRTHLMLSKAGGPPKTFLITSAEEREGKTVTALNLATMLSDTHKKVLLIDADLRCPRIDKIKGVSNKNGLTTLLAASVLKDELIEGAIYQDPQTGVHILPAGEHSINPTNLLASDQMNWLFRRLCRRYDHIVIDSPPALYFADSTILSTIVDSVIIVVRDGVSSSESLSRVQRTLQTVGARVVGMVVNAVPWHSHHYRNYRYYYRSGEIASEEQSLQPLNLG